LLQDLHTPQARPNFQGAENKQDLVSLFTPVGKKKSISIERKKLMLSSIYYWFGLGTCSSKLNHNTLELRTAVHYQHNPLNTNNNITTAFCLQPLEHYLEL
jgi:hypothetical protein